MSKHIIIVDDDKEIRDILTFVLTHSGFEVSTAGNGQQLQHLLIKQIPDLIILDVIMPGEDGYRICRSLQHDLHTSHIPIVIMTAHSEDIYTRISVDVGAAQHITKPFHPLVLVETIKKLLSTTTQN